MLADLKMPKLDGLALLNELQLRAIPTECIIITGQATVDSAVQAMREGAYDYIEKPLNADKLNRLKALIPKALEKFNVQQKNRELVVEARGAHALRRAHRTVRGDARGLSDHRRGRAVDGERADPRRVGNRQGAGRARGPREERAREGSVLRAQLRGAAEGHSRERAVRSREGRVHRLDEREAGRVRDGRRRHDLPRRSRGDVARHSGEAAARARDRARFGGSAARRRSRSTSAFVAATNRICRRRSPKTICARISTIASRSSRFSCRRCASASATSSSSPTNSSRALREQNGKQIDRLRRRRRGSGFSRTTGRATCAS